MSNHEEHIVPYESHLKILVILLLMTVITITVTVIDFSAWTIALALIIASIKVFFVLTYFMHLKYEILIFRALTLLIFLVFAVVIVITFLDYVYR